MGSAHDDPVPMLAGALMIWSQLDTSPAGDLAQPPSTLAFATYRRRCISWTESSISGIRGGETRYRPEE